jgi:hypothetical protein
VVVWGPAVKGTLKDYFVIVSQCFQYYCANYPIASLPCAMNVWGAWMACCCVPHLFQAECLLFLGCRQRFGLVEFINEMGFVGACGSPLPFKSVEAILRVMQLTDNITFPAFMTGLVKLGEQARSRVRVWFRVGLVDFRNLRFTQVSVGVCS